MSFHLWCYGCGETFPLQSGYLSCPNAGDGKEHLLEARPDNNLPPATIDTSEENPFIRYREFLASFALWKDQGWQDEYVAYCKEINQQLSSFGKAFLRTPMASEPILAEQLGIDTCVIKDETGNTGGSHKARHLMGTLLYLEGIRRLQKAEKKPLAIYSCGNAALGAATVAKAAGYSLTTVVPTHVASSITLQLDQLGARVEKVGRSDADVGGGDPCYRRFMQLVQDEGYIPFSCSGNDNWANIDGGMTLGLEIAEQFVAMGAIPEKLFLQVGGGALTRAVILGLSRAKQAEIIPAIPQVLPVQTAGVFPLLRAYCLAFDTLMQMQGESPHFALHSSSSVQERDEHYDRLKQRVGLVPEELLLKVQQYIETNKEKIIEELTRDGTLFMHAWDGTFKDSIAEGILDDVTYDWLPIGLEMFSSCTTPLIASEEILHKAHQLALSTNKYNPSATGTAGFSGALVLKATEKLLSSSKIAAVFTGVEW